MNSIFLMTLLTLNDAGQMAANFVEAETLQACEQKITRIKGIFKVAGITIVKSHCGLSEYRFSKFTHTQTSQERPNSYQITIDNTGVKVTPMKLAECEAGRRKSGDEKNSFCVTSSQSLK